MRHTWILAYQTILVAITIFLTWETPISIASSSINTNFLPRGFFFSCLISDMTVVLLGNAQACNQIISRLGNILQAEENPAIPANAPIPPIKTNGGISVCFALKVNSSVG